MPRSSDRVLALSTRYVRFMAPPRFEELQTGEVFDQFESLFQASKISVADVA